jgi:hypothetical protein
MDELSLAQVVARQAGMISRAQALRHMSEGALRNNLGRRWRVVLPGVYATSLSPLTMQQRLWAARLYAGANMRFTDVTVLATCGVRYLPADTDLHLLVPWEQTRKPFDFVKVTRTRYLPDPVPFGSFAGVPVERALVDFASRTRDRRAATAVFADAVQRRIASLDRLEAAAALATRRSRKCPQTVVVDLRAGIRSAPEQDFRDIAMRAHAPMPLFNPLIELPTGRRISPDALIEDCGLIHETNGRTAHAEEDLFESMQERHDALTTAGFTVLHNSPRRLWTDSALVRTEWEQCACRLTGKGMPPGVVILRRGPA